MSTKELIMEQPVIKRIALTREQFNDAVDEAFYRRIAREEAEKSALIYMGILKGQALCFMEAKTSEGLSVDEAMVLAAKQFSSKGNRKYVDLYNYLFGIVYLNETRPKHSDEEEL